MTSTREALVRLIYLWTRDALMPSDARTRTYVGHHLETLQRPEARYSDAERERLARELVDKYFPEGDGDGEATEA